MLNTGVGHPWCGNCFDKPQCPFKGIEVELIRDIGEVLGFHVEYTKVNDSNEMFAALQNNSSDISCITMERTQENFSLASPTVTINEDFPIFILKDTKGTAVDANLLLSTFHWSICSGCYWCNPATTQLGLLNPFTIFPFATYNPHNTEN